MTVRSLILAGAAVTALGGFATQASAAADPAPKTPKPSASCFFTRNWDGWRSPDENTIYFKVNVNEIFRVDLSSGSRLLTYSDSHLISNVHGTDWICSPLDLDLKVSDGNIVDPIFVKAITKLTPEQIAAIPKKFLP